MSLRQSMSLAALLGILASSAFGGTVSGTVKDPSGAAFKGAFVQAKNAATKITHSVLSDRQGRYRIPDLEPGEYDVQVKAIGYKSQPQKGVKVGTDAVSLDFPLQAGRVEWMDLSIYQARQMLPPGKAKAMLVTTCFACHGIQTRMAPRRQDEASWFRNVDYMRDSMRYFLRDQVKDEMVQDLASLLWVVIADMLRVAWRFHTGREVLPLSESTYAPSLLAEAGATAGA